MELLLDTEIECTTDNENLGHHTNTHDTEFVTYNSSNRKIVIKLENYLRQLDYKLSEYTQDALNACINFMYTFEINLNLNNLSLVREIYCLSIQLSINSLTSRCSKFLIQNLNDSNCLKIRTFAIDSRLITSSTEYIKEYMSKIIFSNEFQQLPRMNIELVGCSPDTTERLNDLLLKWLLNNVDENHQTILKNLCENINILYLNDDKSLHDCCDMDSENKNYSEYINDYQKKAYHQQPQSQHGQSLSPSLSGSINELQLLGNFNEIISTYQTNENNFVAVCIINSTLLTLSVHLQTNLTAAISSESIKINGNGHSSLEKKTSLTNGFIDEFNQNSSSSSPDIDTNDLIRQYETQRSTSQNGTTDKLSKMSSPRCSHGLISIDKKLYIIGGYERGECLTKCETFDPIENKFENFEGLPNRRGRSATVYMKSLNSIFVFGGSDGHRELNSLEKFDFIHNKWSSISFDVSFDCVNTGITADNDFVYLVGIHDNKTNMPIHCLKYDPLKNAFQCISDLNSGRSQCVLVHHNDSVYVFGGHDQIRCLNTCEIFNKKENTWSFIASMIEPRRGCGAAVKNDCVYVVGGTNGSCSLKTTEIYNIQTNKFTIGPELNVPRANVSIAFIGDYLFAVGGFDGKSFLKTIEYLKINDLEAGWSIYHKIDSNFL
jgi:influenza virus NS1A-binding protein